ncbi:hypothetical protein [Sphingobacterium suaedae]|uniref:Uncharacterized protein n=1 Tax=Sphingobacterium suaedae TaxID=1686402 RepID=A0ABW5KDA4_9SPHI
MNEQKDTVTIAKEICLNGVLVFGPQINSRIREIQNWKHDVSTKSGIYHNGTPPLSLLSPFGGKPITFFYERFSVGGKRVRRLNILLDRELEVARVDSIFSDQLIQSLVSIRTNELPEFKNIFRPSWQTIRYWSTYELYRYIKVSFASFRAGLRTDMSQKEIHP